MPKEPYPVGVTCICYFHALTFLKPDGWAPLAVLVTLPASRYIDTAALLLPAIPFALALNLMRAAR